MAIRTVTRIERQLVKVVTSVRVYLQLRDAAIRELGALGVARRRISELAELSQGRISQIIRQGRSDGDDA